MMNTLTRILSLLLFLQVSSAEPESAPVPALMALSPETGTRILLPLQETGVNLEITGGLLQATVTQTYVNTTDHVLETIYTFPLPAQAAVTDLEMHVEGRVIRSVVQEKEQAKKTYETAKREGKKTALLEQKRPNIFTTSTANLAPGQEVRIQISYMETLPYENGGLSVTFPMVVGPRYFPTRWTENADGSFSPRDPSDEATEVNPPLLPPSFPNLSTHRIRATVSGLPLREIQSNTHAIVVKNSGADGDVTSVSLARNTVVPNSEFNLKLLLKKENVPQVTFLQSTAHEEHYGVLNVFPPTVNEVDAPSPPRDVVFLIDTSGSMSGESIGQARSGLLECLDMLRTEDRFTIIRFASEYSSFAPDFRPATAEKVSAGAEYIRNLHANGGTEMQPALRHALRLPAAEGHVKLVVFLTDGCVGNEDDLFRLLEAELGNTRLFTFAIGSAPNEHLIRTMAEQGRGQPRCIRSHEDIGTEMADFFRTLDTPVLTDVSLEWQTPEGEPLRSITQYPGNCPDVFLQRPLQVSVRSSDPFAGSVIVHGRQHNEPVSFVVEMVPSSSPIPVLEKLVGRARIHSLMLEHLRAETPVLREEIRQTIIEAALKHQLVSKYTSRVAVEEEVTVHPDGTLETVHVRVPKPKGWTGGGFSATATSDPALFLFGGALLSISLTLRWVRRNVWA